MPAPESPEQRLRRDFTAFLSLIWRHLGLPRPTPVQLDIAQYLQNGPRRLVIQAFRGVGKSWITSAFVLWLLYRDPHFKILVVSASKDRSDAFSVFTKRLIGEVPFLRYLAPDPSRGHRDSNVQFDVAPAGAAHAPSVKSVGITGQITGSRADYIVVDDAEVPNNSESQLQREKLLARVAELGASVLTPDAKNGSKGGVVYLGTPQVEDSLYTKLPDMGYEVRVWPAEVPADKDRYLGRLAPMIASMNAPAGTPTDPARFDKMELADRRSEYGRAGYALQYLLDTSLQDEDRHPLKLRDLVVADVDRDVAPDKVTWGSSPDLVIEGLPMVGLPGDRWHRPAFVSDKWSPFSGAVMYVDPSGRGKDQTGVAVVKELHGQLFLRQWFALPGGYDDATLTKIATVARDEKVREIVVEDNFGDGMWRKLFQPVLQRIYVTADGAGCALEGDHVVGQKEARIIDILEPVVSSHRLIVDTKIVRENTRDKATVGDPEAALKGAFYQFTRITRERGCLKYDDLMDALAGAVKYWQERMARDVEQAVKERDEERLDAELRQITEHFFGKKPRSNTWGGNLLTR